MIPWMLSGVIVAAACWTDMRRSKIPNKLTVCGTLAGIVFHLWADGWMGLGHALLGVTAGFAVMFILYLFKALGAGDVKLFAALGACVGPELVLYCSLYSLLYAGVIGVVVLLSHKQRINKLFGLAMRLFELLFFRSRGALSFNGHDITRYPFMYAVAPAYLTAAWSVFLY